MIKSATNEMFQKLLTLLKNTALTYFNIEKFLENEYNSNDVLKAFLSLQNKGLIGCDRKIDPSIRPKLGVYRLV